MTDEGVVKYTNVHREAALDERRYTEPLCQLVAWREILAATGLVGRSPELYGGHGYGNVSCRVGPPSMPRGARAFLVTGTQTGGRRDLGLSDVAVVERYDLARNRIESRGRARPSSESLTHGAIYDLGSHIRFVYHAHCAGIWKRSRELGIPTTAADVAYGTPEMAREMARLWRATSFAECRIAAMGGHEDGILVYGRDAEEAGTTLLRYLARGHLLGCRSRYPS